MGSRSDMKITHNGITAVQSKNNDIVLFKNGRMVMHINYTDECDKQDLRDIIDKYHNLIANY